MTDDGSVGDESATTPEEAAAGRTPLAVAWSISAGTVLAGRYEVRRLLGRGGMGIVVQALDRVLGEDVALKLLRPEFASERRWVERLAREVKLARQIHHPNVCRVFDFVQAGDQVFIVMELARHTLRDEQHGVGRPYERAPGDRTTERQLDDVRSVVRGVAAIHATGIIHRDITLANLLRVPDGRLVVSDFGLAIDADETAASLHGGTIAYMAPELAQGGRASFASDVWALGVVIHEIVFGERPRWRQHINNPGLEEPARHLSLSDRMVLNVCRACLTRAERVRPPNASAVERLLSRPPCQQGWRRQIWRWVAATALIAAVAAAGMLLRPITSRQRTDDRGSANREGDQRPILVTGTPEDWTDTSRVLATVHGRIHCLVSLPDHRTIRFVWGSPRRAEDVDVVTGQRLPSPIVPAAYASGCPDLSSRGSLVFQGYDEEGRPVIFKSDKSDGARARAISASASPTQVTEPRWLDNEAVVFSPDDGHVAVVQPSTGKVTILPDDSSVGEAWAGWRVADVGLVASMVSPDGVTHIRQFSWPGLKLRRAFAIGGLIADCALNGSRFYCSDVGDRALLAFDIDRLAGNRLASIRDQEIMFIMPENKHFAFVSRRLKSQAWLANGMVPERQLMASDAIADAADCGRRGYLLVRRRGTTMEVVRLGLDGTQTALTNGHFDDGVDCSPTTETWCFTRADPGRAGVFCCDRTSCGRISDGVARLPSLSPDGTRVVYLANGGGGPAVRWVRRAGGEIREIGVSEGACRPGWSSSSAVWISRRIQGRPWWTEVDADTGQPTGRMAPSANDCQEGYPDPLSPVRPEIRIVVDRISQLRIKDLPASPP